MNDADPSDVPQSDETTSALYHRLVHEHELEIEMHKRTAIDFVWEVRPEVPRSCRVSAARLKRKLAAEMRFAEKHGSNRFNA